MNCNSNAQKIKADKVPTPVKKNLTKAYLDAKKVEWDKENKNFEDSFDNGDDEISVVFNTNETILEAEKKMKFRLFQLKFREL